MNKVNLNLLKNETSYGKRQLDILERELNSEITMIKKKSLISRQREIMDLIDNFKTLIADRKERYGEFLKSNKDNHKTFGTFQSQRVLCQKRIIILNFIALFLFWANVKIGSANSGVSIFGFSLSGLEYYEVITGFVFFLLVFHVRLSWIILSENFILSENYFKRRNEFREEEMHFRRILKMIKVLLFVINPNNENTTDPLEIDEFLSFVNKRKEFTLKISSLVFLWASTLLTLASSFMAFISNQEQFELLIFLFLLSLLFFLWIELFPTPLTKLIRWKFNDLV